MGSPRLAVIGCQVEPGLNGRLVCQGGASRIAIVRPGALNWLRPSLVQLLIPCLLWPIVSPKVGW